MPVGDMLILGLAFLIICWLFFSQNNSLLAFEEFFALRIKIENFLVGIVMIGIWHLTCSSFNLYESKRLSTIAQEIPDIIKATSLVTLTTAGVALLFHIGHDLIRVSAGLLGPCYTLHVPKPHGHTNDFSLDEAQRKKFPQYHHCRNQSTCLAICQ